MVLQLNNIFFSLCLNLLVFRKKRLNDDLWGMKENKSNWLKDLILMLNSFEKEKSLDQGDIWNNDYTLNISLIYGRMPNLIPW